MAYIVRMSENMLEAVQHISVRLYSDVRLFVRDASVMRLSHPAQWARGRKAKRQIPTKHYWNKL
eukprot:3732358-Pyramimonas_sp.AAC.1